MSREFDGETVDRVARKLTAMGDFLNAMLDDASLLDEIPAVATPIATSTERAVTVCASP